MIVIPPDAGLRRSGAGLDPRRTRRWSSWSTSSGWIRPPRPDAACGDPPRRRHRLRHPARPRIRVVPANASAKNPPEERLVNLVVALVATEQGLTKDTILTSVSGISRAVRGGSVQGRPREDVRARQGESPPPGRADRDDRRLGRPRRSARGALPRSHGGVRAPRGHRLHLRRARAAQSRRRRMERELDVGRRAQRAAQDPGPRHRRSTSRSSATRRAISLREPSFAALQQAIEQSRVVHVRLSQARRGRAAHHGASSPLALVEYEGRWHVFGIDLDVAADRTFLLCCASSMTSRSRATRSTRRCARARGSGRSRAWRTSPPATALCSR